MNLRALREYLRGSLWFAPGLGVLLAATAAVLLLALDRAVEDREVLFVFSAGPDSARTFLSTIAASMITFIGLVFTITIVVLQLASQQFSPRVLRTFLRDRQSKVALATFVATFTFALLVLREVRSAEGGFGPPFVPRISITVTFVLVLMSLGAFVVYVHHIAQSVRAATLVDVVGDETRREIDHHYPADAEPAERTFRPDGPPAAQVRSTHAPGVITDFDPERLVAEARDADAVIELVPAVGDFVPEGSVLFRVYGASSVDEDRLREEINFSRERSMQQDVAFGFRQLVDIAIRALSPALNDPTTAVQVLDQVHDLLRRLGTRPFPPGERRDGDGRIRLVYPTTSWEGFVEVGLVEIRQNGAGHVQVTRRMRALLEDLLEVVPDDRRPPLRGQLEALDAEVEATYDREDERALAAEADHKGLGS